MRDESLRRTGIELVGDLPWGTHLCLFYETPSDLIETNVDYFRAGLEDGEFCIWALSAPATHENAIEALRGSITDLDRYLAQGQIELISGYDWYLKGNEFDAQRIIGCWHAKLAEALARGYAGMRAGANAFWFESNLWRAFCKYEAEVDRSMEGKKMIALCTYSLQASRAIDVLDVTRAHKFSIARREGRWEFLETPALKEAKTKIGRLNGANDILSKRFQGKLTARERITLAQTLSGASSKEAARALGVSPRTIEFHRANIMRKLGARNLADLIGKVLGNG